MRDLDIIAHEALRRGEFDAIDWGSSKGTSIEHIRVRYGYERTVGVDMDPVKVGAARAAGRKVIQADATILDVGMNVVDASFMFHFLEHLPTFKHATEVIRRACSATRQGIYIRQPMFGADETLMRLGLRFSWSTWSAHPNRMTTLDFDRILRMLRSEGVIESYAIGYGYPVHSTDEDFILPLHAEDETVAYQPEVHGPKPKLSLSGVYKEVCVAVALSSDFNLSEASRLLKCDHWVFESGRT